MSDLRNKLIRLAHSKPNLRSDLLPLIREAGEKQAYFRSGERYYLTGITTKLSPEGYPEGYATFRREVPASMGLGGYLFVGQRGREIFVPYEDAQAVISK